MRKLQPAVKQETRRVAAGTLILSAVMILVFIITGYFDMTVLFGAMLGTAAAIVNFFLLALSVQHAAEKMDGVSMESYASKDARLEAEGVPQDEQADAAAAEAPEILQAKRSMQASYTMRMMLMALVAIVGLAVSVFHPVAVLVPLLFPQIVIRITGLVQARGKES